MEDISGSDYGLDFTYGLKEINNTNVTGGAMILVINYTTHENIKCFSPNLMLNPKDVMPSNIDFDIIIVHISK